MYLSIKDSLVHVDVVVIGFFSHGDYAVSCAGADFLIVLEMFWMSYRPRKSLTPHDSDHAADYLLAYFLRYYFPNLPINYLLNRDNLTRRGIGGLGCFRI